MALLVAMGLSVLVCAAEIPTVKSLSHAIINDKIADACGVSGLAVTRSGDYLAAFTDVGDIGPGCCGYISRSTDGGLSWKKPERRVKPTIDREGVNLTICNLPDGDVQMAVTRITHVNTVRNNFEGRTSEIELYRASDRRGRNFKLVQKLKTPEGSLFGDTAKVIELPNGDWILPAYGYEATQKVEGAVYGSGFFRSCDKGQTWGEFELAFKDEPPAGEEPYYYSEVVMFVTQDGTLVALARIDSREVNNMRQVESKDCGKTWTMPLEIKPIAAAYPAVQELPDGGFLLVCGDRNARPIQRTVQFYYTRDGKDFTYVGMPYYSLGIDGKPRNPATGGMNSIIPGRKDGQYLVGFYGYHPDLGGYDRIYVDSNIIEIDFEKQGE